MTDHITCVTKIIATWHYIAKLDEAESTLVRCLAETTYEKDLCLNAYEGLPRLEKDRYEERARSAIRKQRDRKGDKPSDE